MADKADPGNGDLQDQLRNLNDRLERIEGDVGKASTALGELVRILNDAVARLATPAGVPPPKPPVGDSTTPGTAGRLTLLLAGAVVVWVVVASLIGKEWDLLLDKAPAQLGFLGFVVALASYLAAVRRESVKALKQTQDPEREDRKKAVARITIAEQALVCLGILTISRIILSPVGANIPGLNAWPLSYTDHLLVVMLCAVIFYLAFLHFREWSRDRSPSTGAGG